MKLAKKLMKNQMGILFLILTFTFNIYAQEDSKNNAPPVQPVGTTNQNSSSQAKQTKSSRPVPAKSAKPELDELENEDELSFLNDIDYPELQVVPRASERLETESAYEKEGMGSWINQWTFLIAGTTTFFAGSYITNSKKNNDSDSILKIQFASVAGLASIGVGAFYAINKPYTSGLDKLKKYKKPTKSQLLYRERIAEEVLEKTALNISTLSIISVSSNLLAGVLLLGVKDIDQTAQTYAIASVLTSSLALVFPNPYVTNWEKQKEYKHKIYTPLPQAYLSKDPFTNKYTTMIGINYTW